MMKELCGPFDKEPLTQQLERLLPSSKRWLESRGYIRRGTLDDERVLEITDLGQYYFARLLK